MCDCRFPSRPCPAVSLLIFFNDTATTEIYTLSLHDALPISPAWPKRPGMRDSRRSPRGSARRGRSEEHTSELQSRLQLVCPLLLGKSTTQLTLTSAESEEHAKTRVGKAR